MGNKYPPSFDSGNVWRSLFAVHELFMYCMRGNIFANYLIGWLKHEQIFVTVYRIAKFFNFFIGSCKNHYAIIGSEFFQEFVFNFFFRGVFRFRSGKYQFCQKFDIDAIRYSLLPVLWLLWMCAYCPPLGVHFCRRFVAGHDTYPCPYPHTHYEGRWNTDRI